MPRPSLLLGLAATALLTSVVYGQRGPSPAEPAEYVGSESCRACHEAEYTTWRKNLHVQMTKPVADARVVGDFRPGTELRHQARAYTMESRDGRYFISVARNGRPPERFEVQYTLGARRFQGYLSKLPDGRIYVLPVFWHQETQRWIDYEEITPIPADSSHDFRQIWNVTCVNCHATNLVRNFDATKNQFATTWTEMGIGCEACHGPGRAHIADPDHLKIFTMKKVAPREIFDACGYCHGNKNNVFFGFKPGDRYDDFAMPFLISQPIPDNDPQGDFWPDGRPSRFNRPQALTETGCFRKGEATCTSCHRMHGSENSHALKVEIEQPAAPKPGLSRVGEGGGHTRQSDQLCTQCHAPAATADQPNPREPAYVRDLPQARIARSYGTAHTHHEAESQGSRCINCHMSDVNWRLFTRRLDHTFQPPVPEMTARYGVPNACTTCHEDRSPEWAGRQMDAWYGDTTRRRAVVALGDTMYRAGAADVTVLPEVAKLTVDRSHGTLIRASAAEFAGQLIAKSGGAQDISPVIVNALIGAANDSEAWVRIAAVRTLGTLPEQPRVMSAIAAHLADPSRLARVAAAEALLNKGLASIEGPAGAALAQAQTEWAESLGTFNDDPRDQTTLGWLESARGRSEAAEQAFNTAIKLDPAAVRPHVLLGVLFARASRFDEALQQFRAVRAVDPSYPNIDRLIDEAQKRR